MSRLGPNQLTARRIETLKDGVYSDGGNLWITVKGTSRGWSFRYTSPMSGRRREMGLGPAREIGLADARKLAAAGREQLRQGIDPLDERKRVAEARRLEQGRTFRAAAALYIGSKKAGWRDPRSEPVWTSSLERYAYPVIGDKPVSAIGTDDVLAVLRPIWPTVTETANRLRNRIQIILDFARVSGWRTGENPARWTGHLSHMLPHPSAVASIEHHAALPWEDIAAVMSALRASGGISAQAVRFLCLTATRSSETRKAPWSEFDFKRRLWVIPKERRKDKKELRVPLSDAMLKILRPLAAMRTDANGYVFPGGKHGQPLSDVALSKALHTAAGTKDVTVHGLRSTFRDWMSEATDFPNELGEMALGHKVPSAVEAAYRRGDMFKKRVRLAEAWSEFSTRDPAANAQSGEPDA